MRDELCGRTIGDFVVRERIGEGGFGAVYRCEQPLLAREAVIKVLHRRLQDSEIVLQRFMREAQLASRLDHPYAAHIYAFGIEKQDGLFWIAMELVQGIAFNEWLRTRGPLPLDQLLPLLDRIAEVIQTAHERGIVHRDLKPSNIMLIERAGQLLPKLLDFGVAKLLHAQLTAERAEPARATLESPAQDLPEPHSLAPAPLLTISVTPTAPQRRPSLVETMPGAEPVAVSNGHSPLTRAGVMVGSPPYMAPEQWSDPKGVGPAADLYALGIMAYEAMTGRRPFSADTLVAFAALHCTGEVPPVGDSFPPALDRFFVRALAKLPEARPATALELVASLRVAAGLGEGPVGLPRLDSRVRDTWIAGAPRPLAESVAMLEGARNAHQARDAAHDLVHDLVRYLLAIALCARVKLRERDEPERSALLRALRERDFDEHDSVQLLRLLARPFVGRRDAYPIPELVDLVTPRHDEPTPLPAEPPAIVEIASSASTQSMAVAAPALVTRAASASLQVVASAPAVAATPSPSASLSPMAPSISAATSVAPPSRDAFDAVLAVRRVAERASSEELARSQLAQLLPALGGLLRALHFLLDAVLVVPRGGVAERWMGLRRQHPPEATARDVALVDDQPVLLDREGRALVGLWPLVQVVEPAQGSERELFMFDGSGRRGARLVAVPRAFEHHDPTVWDWIGISVHEEAGQGGGDRDANAPSPYLGLAAFSAADAGRFVGRERELDVLANRLRQHALQVIAGASGAGKSSLVHAGVVPSFPPTWRTITMRPGAAPMATLAARLVAAGLAGTAAELASEAPGELVARFERAAGTGTLVLVVDQLEELFTLCGDPAEREQFAAILAALGVRVDAPIRVICTVRDDFLMHVEALQPLRGMLSPALFLLGNPSRDDLVRTVVEPARRAGYELSDAALASDMVAEVANRPGALALLSFTALRLWELRDRQTRQLTRRAYVAMRGVGGALGGHAETTYAALAPEEQRLVAEAFRQLVTASRTRAILTREQLREVLGDPRAYAVVDKLLAARLLTGAEADGKQTVEIIHEALIAAWPRLGQWLDEDREGARMREQVLTAAELWQERGRRRARLWAGELLTELEAWLRRGGGLPGELENAFVAACLRARRLSRAAGAVALVVVLVVAGALYRQVVIMPAAQREAQRTSEAQRIASASGRRDLLEGNHIDAYLALTSARKMGDASPALSFMLARAARPLEAERLRLNRPGKRVWSAVFSDDGARILTADDGGATLWDVATGNVVFDLPLATIVFDAKFSPGGTRIATAGADGFVGIWDAATGAQVQKLGDGSQRYVALAWRPDGLEIAATSTGALEVWSVGSGARRTKLDVMPEQEQVEYSADGRWLAAARSKIGIQIWNASTLAPVAELTADDLPRFAFDRSGTRIATADAAGIAGIWDVTGKQLYRLQNSGSAITRIAYSPDAEWVATASRDGVRIWKAEDGSFHREMKNHRAAIKWCEFDRQSRYLVTGSDDGVITVLEVATGRRIATYEGQRSQVTTARFDPSARMVVSSAWDGTARVWEVANFYRRFASREVDAECGAGLPGIQSERRFVAIACANTGTYIWDTARDALIATLPSVLPALNLEGPLPAVANDGSRAALGNDSAVDVYELPNTRPALTIAHHAPISAVAISPDGAAIATADKDGVLKVTRKGAAPQQITGMGVPIYAVIFTPDSRQLLAATKMKLHRFDLVTGAHDTFANDSQSRVRAFRLSTNGTRLVTLGGTGTPEPPVLWDLRELRMIATLHTESATVFSARFVRGDQQLVTADGDNLARIWDAATGDLVATFRSSEFLLDAVLDPSGSILVTAGEEGMLRFWDIASQIQLWSLQAHHVRVVAMHFEDKFLVTRGWLGDVARWEFPAAPSDRDLVKLVTRLERAEPPRR